MRGSRDYRDEIILWGYGCMNGYRFLRFAFVISHRLCSTIAKLLCLSYEQRYRAENRINKLYLNCNRLGLYSHFILKCGNNIEILEL